MFPKYPLDADKKAPLRMVRLFNLNSYQRNNLYDFDSLDSGFPEQERIGLIQPAFNSSSTSSMEIEMQDLSCSTTTSSDEPQVFRPANRQKQRPSKIGAERLDIENLNSL